MSVEKGLMSLNTGNFTLYSYLIKRAAFAPVDARQFYGFRCKFSPLLCDNGMSAFLETAII